MVFIKKKKEKKFLITASFAAFQFFEYFGEYKRADLQILHPWFKPLLANVNTELLI